VFVCIYHALSMLERSDQARPFSSLLAMLLCILHVFLNSIQPLPSCKNHVNAIVQEPELEDGPYMYCVVRQSAGYEIGCTGHGCQSTTLLACCTGRLSFIVRDLAVHVKRCQCALTFVYVHIPCHFH
jgi:hypothetical protein